MQGGTQRVRNVIKQIEHVTIFQYFFNFSVPPKNSSSVKIKVYTQNPQRKKIVNACPAILLERIDGMSIFEELFMSIYILCMK